MKVVTSNNPPKAITITNGHRAPEEKYMRSDTKPMITAALVEFWKSKIRQINPTIETKGMRPSDRLFSRVVLRSLDNHAARYKTIVSFKSSDGCIVRGPTAIHL